MSGLDISEDELEGALTLDQLIEELTMAKASGLATGSEKIAFGRAFSQGYSPVKSVILMPNLDGHVTVGLSLQSEMEWVERLGSDPEAKLNVVDPSKVGSEDPLELARRSGFDKRVAEMERERLEALPEPKAKSKRGPKSL